MLARVVVCCYSFPKADAEGRLTKSLMRQATRSTTYRAAAIERLKDARILLEGKRPSGAIYLGGYAVESMFIPVPAR
jgi:hypothetical protein